MSKSRLTVTYDQQGNAKVVIYPKTSVNTMHALIVERTINNKRFRDKVDKEILCRILQFNKTKISN